MSQSTHSDKGHTVDELWCEMTYVIQTFDLNGIPSLTIEGVLQSKGIIFSLLAR